MNVTGGGGVMIITTHGGNQNVGQTANHLMLWSLMPRGEGALALEDGMGMCPFSRPVSVP